ncbi:MAG: toxin-antitoxin system YwqK family antitoxin, partial [Candidatus Marinimicrobia bacterium]|nr:toxin-antitoxin system YwqK family antitoxin [Candidatus Neomarinimicrobiota bacterium]
MKKTLLTILSLLLIVGCSQKPVDETTLIEKDGVMYLPDSNEPYNGEVFTNYSSGEKEYQGTYENGLLVSYSYLNKDGSVKEPVNMETLIDRGGNLFEINGQKPYTGDVFELYDNGNRKLSGILKGGKLVSRTEWDYYKNGQKHEEWTYKKGVLDGLYVIWYKNGQKQYQVEYIDGKEIDSFDTWNEDGEIMVKNGTGLNIWFHENGQKSVKTTFINGKKDGPSTQWYEDGQIKSEETYKDGVKDGLVTWWYENGQMEQEVTYKDGKKNGLCIWWYENGQKKEESNWVDEKQNGLCSLYDENGKIKETRNY